MSQHLDQWRAKLPRRLPRAKCVQHRQTDRLHHQTRAHRARHGKPLDQRYGMTAFRQQRRHRQAANARPNHADLMAHLVLFAQRGHPKREFRHFPAMTLPFPALA